MYCNNVCGLTVQCPHIWKEQEPSVSDDVGIETQMLPLLHLPQAAVSSVHTHTHTINITSYKYTFSRPGALTGPINYIRAIYNTRHFLFPQMKKTIDSASVGEYVSHINHYYYTYVLCD